ncbi:uncharacterized protein IUM83_11752 [Phytophthora cinnamomi]|uniref:uncharacterized protein n=1 Tax=Phytophthora cinnamomi TaxID=4785 RepID=UPI00355ABB6C|nr:hypothetical protein IUM83_11752 [Phytophthora cinnamomi]
MALEDADACVYVKESVLRELEQERRRLKWQLSRALQTSDVRAAELEASKAKVKDLLTIVEVNKGVADQVVQRSQASGLASKSTARGDPEVARSGSMEVDEEKPGEVEALLPSA